MKRLTTFFLIFLFALTLQGQKVLIEYKTYSDWFLPSKDELAAMYTNLHAEGVGDFATENYWTSSETGASSAYWQSFNDGTQEGADGKNLSCNVRACHSFTATEGAYSLRDVGQAGGLIFYISGTTFYEAALSDQSVSQVWSNIDDTEIGASAQGTAIGTGQGNTTAIIGQAGHTASAAKLCDDLSIVSTVPTILTYDGKVLYAWEPESEAIFAAMGTAPSHARKVLIDNLVSGLKDDGVWSKLVFLYILAAHAENSSLLNWINPGTFDATNVHATAYEVDRGYTGDGANDYLNSNYNPGDGGTYNFLQNSASIGSYNRTKGAVEGFVFGAMDATAEGIAGQFETDRGVHRLNSAVAVNSTAAMVAGFDVLSRQIEASYNYYNNKTQYASGASTSLTVKNFEIYIGAYNLNGVAGGFTSHQVSAAFAGGGMTQTNVNNFHDRLETFLDAIGAGVVD